MRSPLNRCQDDARRSGITNKSRHLSQSEILVMARRPMTGLSAVASGCAWLHRLRTVATLRPGAVSASRPDHGRDQRRSAAAGSAAYARVPLIAIQPLAVSRYRDRHSPSRGKSDAGDAFVLANMLRTDPHSHRPLPVDSALAQSIQALARRLIRASGTMRLVWWFRTVRRPRSRIGRRPGSGRHGRVALRRGGGLRGGRGMPRVCLDR